MKLHLLLLALLGAAVVRGGLVREPAEESPDEIKAFDPSKITFHLWTRLNQDVAHQMYIGYMNDAPFDMSRQTKIIVHGYTQSWKHDFIKKIKENYMTRGSYNVIAVDWEEAASGPLYGNAADRTKPAGEVMGQFIDYLVSEGANINTIHCIGFSLGGHACGFAGKSMTSGKLGRITGLDPAGPNFDHGNSAMQLYQTDAAFVDVVHTCGGLWGLYPAMGHADFYPNGGHEQPGCAISVTGECAHDRSYQLFQESILSGGLVGLICDSMDDLLAGVCDFNDEATLGENCLTTARGIYFLETRGDPPYAMG